MAAKPQIALVSRELYPFGGGGMGNYVSWTAAALAEVTDVTVITTDRHETAYTELAAARDPRLDPRVRFVFAPDFEYDDHGTFYGYFHRWSAGAFDALCAAYPDGGPDLVEFADYHGEGAVAIQARRTGDARFRETTMCVRLNTSAEMVLTLDGDREDDDDAIRAMFELERYSLRYADRVIWPGGDVLATYERFYGADAIAPTELIRHAVTRDDEPPPVPAPSSTDAGERPLRLLFMGRLERRKGIDDLVRALLDLDRDDWILTVVGGDTGTGPLGVSMRGQLELMLAGDERVRLLDRVPRDEVLELVDEHDLCVVPSRWECWPNVVLEALQRGRPVLATPTGGLTEMVKPGRSGFLSTGTGPDALAAALEQLLDDPDQLRRIGSEEPGRVFAELTDADEVRERYLALAGQGAAAGAGSGGDEAPDSAAAMAIPSPQAHGNGASPNGATPPLISVVLTYHRLASYVTETVESLVAQTHDNLELILVNDGSFEPEDEIVHELAERHDLVLVTQPNSGLSAARNFGISQAAGEYVLPFDADDIAEPELAERLLTAIEADPDAAYATCWSRFVDDRGRPLRSGHGYEPLGNWSRLVAERNVAGSCVALIPRRLFDDGLRYDPELTSYEDWDLYRRLAADGLYGHVVPERLYRYRIRRGSMIRIHGIPELRRHQSRMRTHELERSVEWTRSSA